MATTTLPSRPKSWNSLQRLKASLVLLLILQALFLVALVAAKRQHYALLQTIGKDAAPSVILAQQIKVEIGTMDAEAANELLAEPGKGQAARKSYDDSRDRVAGALVDAAKNITYEGEKEAIKSLELGLGKYETAIQQARDFHDRNDPQAIGIYRNKSHIDDLFKAADDLAEVNRKELEKAYSDETGTAAAWRYGAIASGLLLLGLLIYVQWDLSHRVRRLLNPALIAASILTLGLTASDAIRLAKSSEDLRIAKVEAFDSLHALWQCRSFAYASNSDESKYLLQEVGHNDEDAFTRKAQQILPNPDNPENYGGFLGKEMANITFTGEKEAAQKAIDAWKEYTKIDLQIRQLKNQNKMDEAKRLCLGTNPHESDWAFSQFDSALMQTIEINQQHFDEAFAAGLDCLHNFNTIAAIVIAAIAVCSALGLFIRIREYL